MFTIYANGKVLASSHIREPYVVEDPKVTVEKGKASNFQFSIYANHPMYNEMEKMSTYVDVYLDYGHTDRLEYIFSGRILHTEASEDGKMSVYCEGSYAYLVDSIYPPETIEETPEEHFAKIIESHNSQVGVDKQFVIGETDFGNATEPRQYSGSAYRNSQEAIENDLVDVYGGYVQTRKLGATLYIDYLQDSKQKSSQKITFKQNLLAFQDSITGEDLFTILYPLGADVEVTDEESGEETPEEKLAEEPPTDQETEGGGEEEEPWTPAPVEKVKIGEVNNGSDLLENHELVEKFGRITRVQIFDSADTPEKLLEQAQEYMDRYSFGLLQTLTITAIDLKNFDINVESIKVGDVIGVILPFYSKEIELICSEIEYSLDHPEDNQYTIGEPPQDLSAKYDNITTSVTNVSNAMKDNTNAVNRVVQKVGQMGKDIEVNAKNITVNAEAIKANANQIEINANNIQANADQIEINTKDLTLKASDADLVWVKDQVKDVQTDNSSLHTEQSRLMTRMGNVELDINGGEGYVGLKTQYANLYGDWTKFKDEDYSQLKNQVDEAGEWIATADVEINAMEGKIAAKVDATYVDDSLTKYDNDVQFQMSALEGKINLKASSEQVNELSNTVNNVGIELNAVQGTIKLKADSSEVKKLSDDLDDVQTRLGNAEITLNGKEGSIGLVGQFAQLNGDVRGLSDNYDALRGEVDEAGEKIANAELKVNAMEGLIEGKVDAKYVDDRLTTYDTSVQASLNALDASIKLKANSETVSGLDTRLSSAELNISGLEGKIEAKADVSYVDSTKSTIETNVNAELDAQKGLIDLKADTETVSGIQKSLSSVEIRMSTAENDILLRATKEETSKLSDRIKVNEGWIDVNSEKIESYVGITDKLKEDVDGGFIEDEGQRKYKPGLKDKVDLGYTYMGPDGEPVVVPALTERVLVCESDIKQTKDEITLTVRKGDIISSINQSAEAITINASKINLQGYVTVSNMEAEFANIKREYAGQLTTSHLYAEDGHFASINVSGSLTADSIYAGSDINLAVHYHDFTEGSDGTITITSPRSEPGSFKIADTKTYKDGVSAAAKSVTVTGAWSGGTYTATLSNGYSTSTDIAVNSNEVTISYDTAKHVYNINGPISYYSGGQDVGNTGQTFSVTTDDAAYKAGQASAPSGVDTVYLQLSGTNGTSFNATAYTNPNFSGQIGNSIKGYLYLTGVRESAAVHVGRTSGGNTVAQYSLSDFYNDSWTYGHSQTIERIEQTGTFSPYDSKTNTYTVRADVDYVYGGVTERVLTTEVPLVATEAYNAGVSSGKNEGHSEVKVRLTGSGQASNFSAQTYVGSNPSTASTIASTPGYLFVQGEYENGKAYVGTSPTSGIIASLSLRDFHDKSYALGHEQTLYLLYQADDLVYYDSSRNEYDVQVAVKDRTDDRTVLSTRKIFTATEAYNAGKTARDKQLSMDLDGQGSTNFSAITFVESRDTPIKSIYGYLYIKAPADNLKFGSRVYVGRSADSDPVAMISLDDFYAAVADIEWSAGHTDGWNSGFEAGKQAASTTSGTISGVRLEGTNQPNFNATIYYANGTPATNQYPSVKGYLYLDGSDENQSVHVGTSATGGTVAQISVKSVYEDGQDSVYVPTQSANTGTYWSITNNAQHYATVKVKLSNGKTYSHTFNASWING